MDEAQEIPSWPLAWPTAWPRTAPEKRQPGRGVTPFGVPLDNQKARPGDIMMISAVARILAPLRQIGVRDWQVVISTNIELKDDKRLRFGSPEPDDPGVAVYWNAAEPGLPYRCLANDACTSVAANLAAIADTLEALVAMRKAGGDEVLARVLSGLSSMPPSVNRHTTWWADILGIAINASQQDIEKAYRRKRGKNHPDHGGNAEAFQKVRDAYSAARNGVR